MGEATTICLVSPGHFSSNPRLVKEAQALLEAGFKVAAVTSAQVRWFADLDAQMPLIKQLKVGHLSPLSRPRRIVLRLRQMVCRRVATVAFALGWQPSRWLLAEALNIDCRRLRTLLRAHQREGAGPFSLVIAHNLAALPAAATVAGESGCGYAFDAEDSHVDELYPQQVLERRIRAGIESAWLPGAKYVSAASPGIARALEVRYGIVPKTILNVFETPADLSLMQPTLGESDPLRFFWFSQTVGPDRGLDQFMALVPAIRSGLRRELQLTIVGRPAAGFDQELLRQAAVNKINLNLKPLMPPDELYGLAASHHCGLALEHPTPVNKDLCLANKIFTYLAAGIPMLLTPTSAHRALSSELGDSALLLETPAPDQSPEQSPEQRLVTWLNDVVCTGQGALQAQQKYSSRFNWPLESKTFVDCVRNAL